MKFVAIHAIPYDVALPRPIVTAHGVYVRRKGLILGLKDDDGILALGDVAPLPGFSCDSLTTCELEIRTLSWNLGQGHATRIEDWEHSPNPKDRRTSSENPSLWFGLATALADWRGKRRQSSLAAMVNSDAARSVPVNGLISESNPADAAATSADLRRRGFMTHKVKMAACDPMQDVARVMAICDRVPDVALRLDANQGWDMDAAKYVLSRIPRERIDFIEQPLQQGPVTADRLLCDEFGLRLALDEAASHETAIREIISRRVCDVLVLKPMILGRWYQCHLLAKEAQEAGIDVVYTSSWESDIGVAATLHLAAALGPNPPAMGLSTAGMIAEGIVKTPLKIENGYLEVPQGPGLGMELAPELLERMT